MACLDWEELPYDHRDNGGSKQYWELNCYIHGTTKTLFFKHVRHLIACMNQDKQMLTSKQWDVIQTIIRNKFNTNKITPILYMDFLIKLPKNTSQDEFYKKFDNIVNDKLFHNEDNYDFLKERFRTIDVDKFYSTDVNKNNEKKMEEEEEEGKKKSTNAKINNDDGKGDIEMKNASPQNNIMKKPANKKVCLLRESLQRNQQESNQNFNSLREIKELDSWMDPSIAQLD